jgi:malto-oligosyltrehalose trehalohydrolase
MVFLDVVYNHFGPEGNYLASYAPSFFRHDLMTPWGDAIDFRQRQVRDFFIQNALQWLEEYRFDGLRLDAVHAIRDDSPLHFLDELAAAIHGSFAGRRHIHLVLENEHNEARRLGPGRYTAQWNDDWHNCAHVLLTGERSGYYGAFADRPMDGLVRSLAQGFVFQGEPSPIHDGRARGEPSAALPPTAFVNFLQNHDQTGNRALGERLGRLAAPEAVETLTALLLLSPQIPLLFMGEEWDATSPFLFFTDYRDELAAAVREGRRREFAKFPAFADATARVAIPDPNAASTFEAARLRWEEAERPPQATRLALVRDLLAKRRRLIAPLLPEIGGNAGEARRIGDRGLLAEWRLTDGRWLVLQANLGPEPEAGFVPARGRRLHPDAAIADLAAGRLPPWALTLHQEHSSAAERLCLQGFPTNRV